MVLGSLLVHRNFLVPILDRVVSVSVCSDNLHARRWQSLGDTLHGAFSIMWLFPWLMVLNHDQGTKGSQAWREVELTYVLKYLEKVVLLK